MHEFTMKRPYKPGNLISAVEFAVVTESQPAGLCAHKSGHFMRAAHQMGMHGESICFDHASYTSVVIGCCMRVPAQVLIAEHNDIPFWKDMTDYPCERSHLYPTGSEPLMDFRSTAGHSGLLQTELPPDIKKEKNGIRAWAQQNMYITENM